MNHATTASRSRGSAPGPTGGPRRVRRRSNAPHHRRRRWTAAAVSAAIVLLAVLSIASAGGAAHHHGQGPAPAATHYRLGLPSFLPRIGLPTGVGRGTPLAARTSAQNAAIDRTLAYTPYVRIAGSQHREIALSFDDGPGPYTPAIVDVLQRHHMPATFFEVGVLERYFHDATARIAADGFPIGDHTEIHAPMAQLSAADQRGQLLQDASALGAYGAPFPRMFRPPYGVWNSTTLALLKRYRMLMVLWTVDTRDYERPGVPAIVHAAVAGARPGAIILLHDAGGDRSRTVAALPAIIRDLRARGYKLVTVPRLLLDNRAPRSQVVAGLSSEGGG